MADSMHLLGNIYSFSGTESAFRGTWTPNAEGSVRQSFGSITKKLKAGMFGSIPRRLLRDENNAQVISRFA